MLNKSSLRLVHSFLVPLIFHLSNYHWSKITLKLPARYYIRHAAASRKEKKPQVYGSFINLEINFW